MPDTFHPDILQSEPPDSSPSPEASSEGARPEPSGRAETAEPRTNGEEPKGSKKPGAYERAKARVAKERAELANERTRLQQERAQLDAQRKAAQAPPAKKRDYTLADLRKYHAQWNNPDHRNYDPDLAEKAQAEMQAMEAEEAQNKSIVELPKAGTPEHEAQWHQAEAELAQADPEFQRNGTKLDARLREIMGSPDGDIYRQHPRGIIAAYHKAKMDLLQADNGELQAKIQDLEKELKRYHGLTGVSGGNQRRLGSEVSKVESLSDFAKLDSKKMRQHLLSNARRNGSDAPLF
jgi:hypothetical protein